MNSGKIELEGSVIEANKGIFRIQVNDNHIVMARLSGKIRQNGIHILVGDTVIVEVSEYNLSSGRIIFRNK